MRDDQRLYDPSRLHAPKATEEGENTCVFVGGLDESVSPDMLRRRFRLQLGLLITPQEADELQRMYDAG